MISPEEEAKQRRAKQLEEQRRQKEAAEAAAAAAAKEKVAQRQWILQYAEDDSESDADDHDAEQVSRCSNSVAITATIMHTCLCIPARHTCTTYVYCHEFHAQNNIKAAVCKDRQRQHCLD